jgi:hypothetical protein
MRNARFAALRERLLREGVAPKHVRRTVAELEAHHQDIVAELLARGVPAEQASAEARVRLGSDDTLAASVLARPELRSWARKRPWAAFTIIPVLSFAAALVLWIVAFVMVIDTLKTTLGMSLLEMSGVRPVTQFLFGAAVWGLPVAVGAWAVWFAATRRAGVVWPIAGVVVIALLGSVLNMSLTWPEPPARPEFSAGAGFSTEHVGDPAMRAGVTTALVLTPFLLWRRSRTVK